MGAKWPTERFIYEQYTAGKLNHSIHQISTAFCLSFRKQSKNPHKKADASVNYALGKWKEDHVRTAGNRAYCDSVDGVSYSQTGLVEAPQYARVRVSTKMDISNVIAEVDKYLETSNYSVAVFLQRAITSACSSKSMAK